MNLTQFDYQLPEELIASYPLSQRADSRLLILERQSQRLSHGYFAELAEQLRPHDLLVFNDSRVMQARLFAVKPTGGKVEILIERILNDHLLTAQVGASKAPKPGGVLQLEDGSELEMLAREGQWFQLRVRGHKTIWNIMEDVGHIPLPHYMKRQDERADRERYQTVYARRLGSVAAPTAGLHFDDALLNKLREKGVAETYVTLHVGAGTYQPVRVEDIREHVMHSEWVSVSEETCQKVSETRARGGRIIAVGTTSVRCLETASASGVLSPYSGETRIFIYPGYRFHSVDGLITNFHLPKSSLLMLVSALAGIERIKAAYQEAIQQRYRFYSYGDAMLII